MGFLKEVIVALIVAIITGSIAYIWKNRKKLKFFSFFKLIVNIKKSGMLYFFYNKDMLRKQLGTIGDEIGRAKTRFIYIGYTMSDIIRQDMEEALIKAINERDVSFEFCILDGESECANLYAMYTGREIDEIKVTLNKTAIIIERIRDKIKDDKKNHLKLLKHNLFITSSCFLIDIEESSGWIHFNYKAPKATKFQDFGFVLTKSKFYDKMKESYLDILADIYKYNGN